MEHDQEDGMKDIVDVYPVMSPYWSHTNIYQEFYDVYCDENRINDLLTNIALINY